MIAAIYARKSTDQNAPDEEKSVTRQIERARAYALAKGWTVDEAHVYVDDGISGAEFVKRPGFLRLMNALKPQAPFHVLVMAEESRLGREQIATAYALKQFSQAGVRVFLYLEDRERTLDSPTEKLLMSVAAFADEMEREKARQRTYDALARNAARGHVTGGKVYGYDNLEILDAAGERAHVVRQINPAQAAVVRRIFAASAEGAGFTRIAKRLNADGIAPPRHASGWAPTAVREILLRPLYRGEIVWNRTEKRDRWGVTRYLDRPASTWLHLDAPALRIVPEELWRAAHVRLDQARALYARGDHGTIAGRRPGRDFDSRYLLSGLASCAVCRGSIVGLTRDRKRPGGRRALYGCAYYHKRGPKVCSNSLLIRQEALDAVVLDAVASALDARLLDDAVDAALAKLRGRHRGDGDRRTALRRDLEDAEKATARLVDAIARGGAVEPLLQRLRAEEDRKRALSAELESIAAPAKVVPFDERRIRAELREKVANVRALLGRNVHGARQILQKLVVGKLECAPVTLDGGGRGYRLTGEGSYAPILPPAVVPTMVVTPAGFEPAISTLKGSRPGPG